MDEIRHKEVIFGGDFNINFKTNNTEVSELKKFIIKSALKQFIKEPTLISHNGSLIDLILSDSEYINHTGVLDIDISDHLPFFLLCKKENIKSSRCDFCGRSYRNYDKLIMEDRLLNYSWIEFYNMNDVNQCWQLVLSRVLEILDDMCPKKRFSFDKEKQPWLYPELMVQLANRDDAIKEAWKSGTPEDLLYARKIRNKRHNLITKAKSDYYI